MATVKAFSTDRTDTVGRDVIIGGAGSAALYNVDSAKVVTLDPSAVGAPLSGADGIDTITKLLSNQKNLTFLPPALGAGLSDALGDLPWPFGFGRGYAAALEERGSSPKCAATPSQHQFCFGGSRKRCRPPERVHRDPGA